MTETIDGTVSNAPDLCGPTNAFQRDQEHGWILICEGREIADLRYETIDDPWWIYIFKPRPGQEAACDRVATIASREALPENCYLKNRQSDGVLTRETCLISGDLESWFIRDGRPHADRPLPRLRRSTVVTWLGAVQGVVLSLAFQSMYGLPYITWLVGFAMGFYLAVIELWFYDWLRRS